MQAFVDVTGKVDEAIVIDGILDTGLDGAAMAAIQKTIFKPALQKDQPVGVWIAIPIVFNLKKESQVENN